jgi:hypothetical protein
MFGAIATIKLGLARSTLISKMKRLGISKRERFGISEWFLVRAQLQVTGHVAFGSSPLL